jgi:hypothetical protein
MEKQTKLIVSAGKLKKDFKISSTVTEAADVARRMKILKEQGIEGITKELSNENEKIIEDDKAGLYDVDDQYLNDYLKVTNEIIENNPDDLTVSNESYNPWLT